MDEGGEEPPEYPIEDEEEGMDPRPRWIQETLTAELDDDFFHARLEELIRRRSWKFTHPEHALYWITKVHVKT